MNTFICTLAAVVSLAHSVVDEVDFTKITATIMQNRAYSKQKISLIDRVIKQDYEHGINLSKTSNQDKLLNRLKKDLILTPTGALQKIDYKKLQDTAILLMYEEFRYYNTQKVRNELYSRAEQKYKYLQVGDTVTVRYRFCGKLLSATGQLHNVDLYKNVTVDNKIISFVDMDEIQQQLFAKKSVETLRERYVNEHFKAMELEHIERQKKFLIKQYAKLLDQAFRKNEMSGYIYNHKEQKWWSARFTVRHYLDSYAGKQRTVMKKRINAALNDLGLEAE